MRDRWTRWLLVAAVAQLPFELRYTLLGLTNLQWTFAALAVAGLPLLIRNWKALARNRLVQAAGVFVAVQWLAALFAPEFNTNAIKAAIRFSAGYALLLLGTCAFADTPASEDSIVTRTWTFASGIGAVYALLSYAGFGAPWLFRDQEYYIGQIQRLSGSLEYPNTAAAYFAMSLPIVWWSESRRLLRIPIAFFLWCAIVLTFSKGALLAVPAVALLAAWRRAMPLLAIGLAAYVALLPLNPYLVERLRGPGVRNPIAAEYTAEWNHLVQRPGVQDQIPLTIRNTGVSTWRARGWWRVGVAYRWWNRQTESFVRPIHPVISELPQDVRPGDTVRIPALVQTPDQPGRYILAIELFSRNLDWFSQTGVVPALIDTDIQPSAARSTGQTDLSAFYGRKSSDGGLTAAVPRSSLWWAALKMFLDHPFGAGPDNYRLQYGKYLGAKRWDTNVYSNNLYLELLAGSGILGLAAFLFVLLAVPWRASGPALAMAVFLAHGMVDVFLMTTPIYFAFWISAGLTRIRLIHREVERASILAEEA